MLLKFTWALYIFLLIPNCKAPALKEFEVCTTACEAGISALNKSHCKTELAPFPETPAFIVAYTFLFSEENSTPYGLSPF